VGVRGEIGVWGVEGDGPGNWPTGAEEVGVILGLRG